jgi:L-ribulose-5-phosphate 3-epimerase
MKPEPSRRDFLKASMAAAAGASLEAAPGPLAGATPTAPTSKPLPIQKGVLVDMLPKNLSYADRFKMARDAGFQVLQAPATRRQDEAEGMKKAAEDAGVRIDSVMNMAHWKYPLSASDPAVVEKGIEGMRTSLHNAKLWGAGAVLLVPAVVSAATSYREAWVRSSKQIRRLIPLAAELKVVIAIEEVWNKLLLSPLEMAAYVDEFKSPWVQAWFDVGNVVLYGYPQDWVRTLGRRINRLHLKDFKLEGNSFYWENLGDGAIDWAAVRQSLAAVGFRGSAVCELKGGDEAYLRDVSKRVDRLVLGV